MVIRPKLYRAARCPYPGRALANLAAMIRIILLILVAIGLLYIATIDHAAVLAALWLVILPLGSWQLRRVLR